MSDLNWVFHQKQRTEPERNPTRGEHFRRSADRGPASMIVREGVQNALDARIQRGAESRPVKVRIYVSGLDHALPAEKLQQVMTTEFVRHLTAEGAGLIDPPSTDSDCPYLVFEDFGTTGLTGDVEQDSGHLRHSNRFYYFLRAEAANDKHGGELGSWGVGKTVFPSASRINTILIRSVRESDDTRPVVVMGRTILRYHELDGDTWRPDAWLGVPVGADRFPLPGDDSSAEVLSPFSVTRGTESGLSIIVPYADLEEITYELLIRAMLEEYTFSIAQGLLVATIEAPGQVTTIDQHNVGQVLEAQPEEKLWVAIGPVVRAARAFAEVQAGTSPCLELKDPWPYREPGRKGAIRWDLDWMDDPLKSKISESLAAEGGAVTIRVPLHVEPQHGSAENSEFLVYLEADPEAGNVRPVCLREGLLVPGTAGDRPDLVTGVRAVIFAPKGSLAELLRAAEDPSHMTWSHRTENFKEKYKYGKAYLSFVRSAPREIVRLARGDTEEEDRDLFQDLISIVEQKPQQGKRRRARPTKPSIPPRQPRISVEQRQGGFRVVRGSGDISVPAVLTVRCAYDCDERDPFKMYEPFDFNFERSDLEVALSGCAVAEKSPNRLRVAIESPDFELNVSGFDEKRDLVIRAFMRDAESGEDAEAAQEQ